MAKVRTRCITILGKKNLDCSDGSPQTVYTVPAGERHIPTHVIFDNASATLATAIADMGFASPNFDDFRKGVVFTNVDAAGEGLEVRRDTDDDGGVTPVPGLQRAGIAADDFKVHFTTTIAGTVDVYVLGIDAVAPT